jgi:glutamate synthase (NADPH/NADH) small chain
MSDTNPLKFLQYARSDNKKRAINERKIDFNEIVNPKEDTELTDQAGRCIDCGNPYCEWKCPLHNYIPNWLSLVQSGKFDQAATLMHETNPLPEICGRVCPQDRLCEQACTINTGFGAVTIGAIEKNISDRAIAKNWRPDLSNIVKSDKKVAIVGAGPAGLGCAELLARNGIASVVFDKQPEIGGLLTFGIPGFKLEKEIIRKRKEFLQDLGIQFRLNTEIGKDIEIKKLESEYDAIFLGMGCYTSVTGDLVGNHLNGVINAIDYLIGNINFQQSYNMDAYPYQNLQGKKVVVLGGGDTAMDCVRSAIRQQADSVTCVYRRDSESMPGSRQEFINAKEEGVAFLFNQQPLSIIDIKGHVSAVKLAETELQQADSNSDRKTFVVNQSKTSTIDADVVILAFGFRASPEDWFSSAGIKLDDYGLVKTKPTNELNQESITLPYLQQTDNQNIFAGGDMVRGADLVVTAIAEGRQAALEIIQQLDQ